MTSSKHPTAKCVDKKMKMRQVGQAGGTQQGKSGKESTMPLCLQKGPKKKHKCTVKCVVETKEKLVRGCMSNMQRIIKTQLTHRYLGESAFP